MYDSWLFAHDLVGLCTSDKDQLPAVFSAVLPHIASSILQVVSDWGPTLDGSLFGVRTHDRPEGWGSYGRSLVEEESSSAAHCAEMACMDCSDCSDRLPADSETAARQNRLPADSETAARQNRLLADSETAARQNRLTADSETAARQNRTGDGDSSDEGSRLAVEEGGSRLAHPPTQGPGPGPRAQGPGPRLLCPLLSRPFLRSTSSWMGLLL